MVLHETLFNFHCDYHHAIFRPATRKMIENALFTESWNRTFQENRQLIEMVFNATKTYPVGWELVGCLDSIKVLREIGFLFQFISL